MSVYSPHNSRDFQYDGSTPPPPPPKPLAHSSGQATPLGGPPRPPPPPSQNAPSSDIGAGGQNTQYQQNAPVTAGGSSSSTQPPGDGWLPDIVTDKTTADLEAILSSPALQQALIHSPETAHPSLPASSAAIQNLLSENIALATTLKTLEAQIQHERQTTQTRLLSLRALERQWRAKQAEQDAALRDFSPPALYQRLSAAVGEQEALCRGLEESFVEGETGWGAASDREVNEFVRRVREARKVAYLRRERKERWDEGRVGGWR